MATFKAQYSLLILIVHVIAIVSKEVRRNVGDSVILECRNLTVNQEFEMSIWRRQSIMIVNIAQDGTVDYPGLSVDDIDRYNITSDTQLEILDLQMKDSADYRCTTHFFEGSRTDVKLVNENYTLVVQDKPGQPGKPMISNIESRNVTVSWKPSQEMNNSPIQKYILSVSKCDVYGRSRIVEVHDTGSTGPLTKVVDGLHPYTCYAITVKAENSVGVGAPSVLSDKFYTEAEDKTEDMDSSSTKQMMNDSTLAPNVSVVPPAKEPYNFHVVEKKSTAFVLKWDPPPQDTLNGKLLGYDIEYFTDTVGKKALDIIDPTQLMVKVDNLKPYTFYTISVQARNSAGPSPKAELVERTEEGAPSNPRVTHVSDRKSRSFRINWEAPAETNGRLIRYILRWKSNGVVKTRTIGGHLVHRMSATIDQLTPYTEYVVSVAAVTNGGQGPYSSDFIAFTDSDAPSPPRNLNVTIKSMTSVLLTWERPVIVYNTIDNYYIKGWNNRQEYVEKWVKGDLTEYTLSKLTRHSRYHVKICAVTKAFEGHKWMGEYTPIVNFTLGGGDIEIWDQNDLGSYPHGQSESGSIKSGIIVAIVFIVILLTFTIVLIVGYRFYTCRKCYQDTYRYFAVSSNGMQAQQPILPVEEPSEEKLYPDIDVADFLLHVERMHSDSDIAFSQEFDEINRAFHSGKYMHENSELPENRAKNRYINIVAYDHSRVILRADSRPLRQPDYINANYVDGYNKPKAYIATQGPLTNTFADFWRMVWEQNTNVIVMITNLMEKGRRKCDQYWPSEVQDYGNIQVKLIKTVHRAHYTVRIFTLRNIKVKKRHSMKGSAERTIYHYHYTEWPDHGVPDYSLPVLSFVQKSAAQSGPENGPIIVHCSAGVGRTGTYILIDSMIAQIKDKQSINIPGFTQQIRRQRNFLVQTEDQYIFIHEVLKEYLLADGVTEVREEQMVDYLQKLEQPAKSRILSPITDATVLQKQYQLLTEYTPSEMDLSAALKPVNQEKNRVGSILPVNMKRVLLPARPGVDGSDYINATFLQGYKKSAEFIVTQHPTEDTMEDFWRMVWDKNCPAIVVLSAFDNLEYKEFWPPLGSSIEVDSGNFKLVMKDEPNNEELQEKGIKIFEFILNSMGYDYTLMTRIICVKEWPSSFIELQTVVDPIVLTHGFINSLECGPIVVMDRFGGVEAGTFCALWTLRDQLLSEKCCDFYEVSKLYHYKRPGILGSQSDYHFLHQVIAALCTRLLEERNSNGSSPRHHHNHHSFHFPSLHSNNTSTAPRQNGTLPRSSPNTNSGSSGSTATTPTSNNLIPLLPPNGGSGSHTLPRANNSNPARKSTTSTSGSGGGEGEDNSDSTTNLNVDSSEVIGNKETNI